MCGRYVIEDYQELSERLTQVPLRYDFQIRPSWNASPSQTLPVVVEDDAAWVVRGMQWGLVPKWTKPGTKPKVTPINARSETAADKPMFRSLLKYRRCIVPANGFYEWKRHDSRTKRPFYIHLNGEPLMLFAGLWDEAETEDGPLQSFTILTTSANEQMADLHDRMPVILDPDDADLWLSREEIETGPLESLLRPLPEGELDIYEVDRQVNSPRNNDPSNIEPLNSDVEGEGYDTSGE
jgi:putative SOS response-associated peptidase YedK